jgi:hypothetical protein
MRKQSLPEPFEKLVQEAKELNQLLSDEARARQVAPTPPITELPIRPITITSNDIIMTLADLMQDLTQPGGVRVQAANSVAEIFLLKARTIRDLNNFYGWTTDELKRYSETGETPERLRPFLAFGEGAAINGSASLRTDKNARS